MATKKKIRVAINGLGRIGRATFRLALDDPGLEVVAVNDLADSDNLAYLIKYDSAYGVNDVGIKRGKKKWIIDKKSIDVLQEGEPANLPWRELGVDVVIEATGVFSDFARAKSHIDAGARKVVISAPAKGEPPPGLKGGTVVMGVNEAELSKYQISSNASCTTNATAPVIAALDLAVGVKHAMLNTVHGYTVSQQLVDCPDEKDWRRGRAAAVNLVPSSTGAAKAVAEVWPSMSGKFDGVAIRVPVLTGSMADITFVAKRSVTEEQINNSLRQAAVTERWRGVIATTEEPLVSSDIIGRPEPAIVDLSATQVVGSNLVKVLIWYDNEMGYASTLVRHVLATGRLM